MENLPAPPVGADVDLHDFDFTPMYRGRLFGSAFHARATDAEWRAGVTLWLKSQDQSPAGSLPDDDIELCRLAELGRDLKTWRKLRPGALHGWYRCSDGRIYHKVVAEVVNEQWIRKLKQRHRTYCAAVKKWNQRHPSDQRDVPDFDDWLSQGQPANVTRDITAMSLRQPRDVPRDIGSKGQGQGQGQGDKKKELPEPTELLPRKPAAAASPPTGKIYAFNGAVIRLTETDFNRWKSAFHAIPDLAAELEVIDAKFVEEQVPRDKAFGKASSWLRTKHDRLSAEQRRQIGTTQSDADSQWRARLNGYRQHKTWLGWGPKPSEPGCYAPAHILREFGYSDQPAAIGGG